MAEEFDETRDAAEEKERHRHHGDQTAESQAVVEQLRGGGIEVLFADGGLARGTGTVHHRCGPRLTDRRRKLVVGGVEFDVTEGRADLPRPRRQHRLWGRRQSH